MVMSQLVCMCVCVRRARHTATHSSRRSKLALHDEIMSLRNILSVPSTARESKRLREAFGCQALLGYIKFAFISLLLRADVSIYCQ